MTIPHTKVKALKRRKNTKRAKAHCPVVSGREADTAQPLPSRLRSQGDAGHYTYTERYHDQ
jgi:hypothetical protein